MANAQSKKKKGKTIAELAREFNRPLQSMRSFCLELVPVGKDGNSKLFNPAEVKTLLATKIARAGKTTAQQDLEARKLELQCQKLQNEIDVQVRNLLPVGEVTRCISTLVESVRTHLLAMPPEVAPLIEGQPVHKIQQILKEHHLKCLEQLQETKFE